MKKYSSATLRSLIYAKADIDLARGCEAAATRNAGHFLRLVEEATNLRRFIEAVFLRSEMSSAPASAAKSSLPLRRCVMIYSCRR